MFPISVPSEFIPVLNDWHGGQGSAFYSLASTGKIYNSDYLTTALGEAYLAIRISSDDWMRLNSLVEWLEEKEKTLESQQPDEE